MSASSSAAAVLRIARHGASSLPRALPRSASRSTRTFASSTTLLNAPRKPSIAGIASLRKSAPGTSMLKAREAISATWNEATGVEDLDAALRWLEEDRQKSGAKKADKVAGREAKEGLVGICVLQDGLPAGGDSASAGPTSGLPQAGMVELNCETDFVARNELFGALLRDLAHTASFFPIYAGLSTSGAPGEAQPELLDLDLEAFLAFPLLPSDPASSVSSSESAAPKTVQDAIVDAVARLGERIHLARATSVLPPPLTPPSPNAPRRSSLSVQTRSAVGSFAHGATSAASASGDSAKRLGFSLSTGRVASLLLTRFQTPTETSTSSALTNESGQAAARGLLRSLARQTAGFPTLSIDAAPGAEEGSALLDQPFAMLLSSSGLDASSLSGSKVSEVLDKWTAEHLGSTAGGAKAQVADMRRWEVGGSQTA